MTGEENLILSEVHQVAPGDYAEIAKIVNRLLADERLTEPQSLRIDVRWNESWDEDADQWVCGHEVTFSASMWRRPINSEGVVLDQADVP